MWFVCLLQISLPLTVMLLKALWLFFFLTQMFYFFISPSLLLLSSFVQLNQSLQKYLGRMLWDGSGCRMWNDSTMGTARPGPRALNSSRPNPQPFPLGTDQGCRRPTRVSAEVQPKKKEKMHKSPSGTRRCKLRIIVSALICELQKKESVSQVFKRRDARSVNSNESDLGLMCIWLCLTLWETNQ